MSKRKKIKDPHAKREAKKYDNPIASREFILDLLAEKGSPLHYDQLAAALHLETDEQFEALRRRLIAMLRDGQLMKNRRGAYALVNKMDLIAGTVQAHKDGYGFLIPDKGGDDLFLSAKQMRLVLNGDRVLARASEYKGKLEGTIVEVLERNTHETVGRFCEENGVCFVIPSSKNLPHDIIIPPDKRHAAKDGQMVLIKLIAQPDARRHAMGEVIDILGEHMAPGMEIDVALLAYNIPHKWPDAVVSEAKKFTPEVTEADCQDRTDLRDLPLITIDGEDARDFDDAVYCQPKGDGGWRLVVAIADVSYYVTQGSALDIEAELRGNSVYFPERVIPMLPEALSNGLCSLNPKVDRLCMVCDMNISKTGKITRYRFYDAVMHSKARMTYNKVQAIIDGDSKLRSEYQAIVEHVDDLYALYQVLREQREIRGALDFDTRETRIIFGEDKKIEKIVPVVRNQAHMLIEECMLCANVCAAKFLKTQKLPGLFRVHETPKEEKMQELRQSLALHGLTLGGGDHPQPIDFQKILQKIQKHKNTDALQMMVLRSLNQAQYTAENGGHFGLAYKEYGHFTSPIRRYPDLLLHRAIRHFLKGGDASNFSYTYPQMNQLGEHCSMTERGADDATRDVVNWLKCEYMSHHVGEEYSGKVTGVTAFGLFVILNEVYVEGLVHVTLLKDDYYHFDNVRHMLIGERAGTRYSLGQSIKVKVIRVDMEQRKIDFELLAVAGKKK
jgi:ribonuclease R